MDRKERILGFVRSHGYVPLKFDELMSVLDVPSEDAQELQKILDELCNEGNVYVTKRGRYVAVGHDGATVSGVLRCAAGGRSGFIDMENGASVHISADNLIFGASGETAFDGDRVIARIDESPRGNQSAEGHIIKILERANTMIVGVILKEKDGVFKIAPDNSKIYASVRAEAADTGVKVGDRVCVRVTEFAKNGKIYGEIIAVLGERDSLKSSIEGIIIENGIKQEFDEDTLHESERVPDKISPADIRNRSDLRDKLIFTIDGETARDFDDAVSLDILENGNYRLGVHIADVSHYVRPETALDNEAFERGTSVYLADRVIPMLPERLSNGICSLNPNEDRLTMSAIMEIDKNGDVVDHEICETVIRSKERMTYEDVNAIFDGDEPLSKKYAHLLPTLNKMAELAEILNNRRKTRGSIMFDFPETGIAVDEDGNPTDIFYEERGISNKMIEEFMLAANETVAEHAYWAELPFVYRIHEPPSEDKITEFNKLISQFGITIKGKIDRDNPVHPKALQDILDKITGEPEENMIAKAMLRSLMKASYRDENLGHFGLAAKYYCHFTSPIRRYPDLAIHRILKAYLHGESVFDFDRFASNAASHSSEREIAAVQAERDVDDLMKAAYMADFVGEAYDAIVSGVTSFGMFVTLENSVEGLIRAENMTDDYYEYDEASQRLTGQRTGQIYRVGDAVRVVLARSDIRLRRIDFVLEKDADKSLLRKFEDDLHGRNGMPPKNRRQRRAAKHGRKAARSKHIRRSRRL